MGERQQLEILIALSWGGRIVILDEPTSSTGESGLAFLRDALAVLRERGVGVVYISHKLPEVVELADRITVMRRGAKVWEGTCAGVSAGGLARVMVGDTALLVASSRRAAARGSSCSRSRASSFPGRTKVARCTRSTSTSAATRSSASPASPATASGSSHACAPGWTSRCRGVSSARRGRDTWPRTAAATALPLHSAVRERDRPCPPAPPLRGRARASCRRARVHARSARPVRGRSDGDRTRILGAAAERRQPAAPRARS